MKRFLIILILILLITGTAEAKTQKIKVSGCGVSSNKVYIKTDINGHKITLRTPKISKNKYLKLVNVAL